MKVDIGSLGAGFIITPIHKCGYIYSSRHTEMTVQIQKSTKHKILTHNDDHSKCVFVFYFPNCTLSIYAPSTIS